MKSARTPMPGKIATRLGLIVAVAAVALGISAAPASAAVIYDTNPVQACQEQGHMGASFWNPGPYGWFCYDPVPSPPFWTPAGGVDFQGWCNRHVSGSRAIIYKNNLFGWKCSRNW
jgi:hypothetical protein